MQTKKFKLVISSGKGGVGKSMLTSSLALLLNEDNKKIIAVDCDVDAPNLAVWLGEPENWQEVKKISVSERPLIDNSKLTKKEAERCTRKCRFNALRVDKGKLKLNPFLCEGCGVCEILYPQAIKLKPVKNGEIKIKEVNLPIKLKEKNSLPKNNFLLVAGQLYPGETGSGKVVTEIKKAAEKYDYDLMLIDSAPGTGCPVIASLKDADFVLLVTEPTPSGFSDLKRVLKVVNYFKISYRIVINKWDINPELSQEIENWANNLTKEILLIGKISYDKKIVKAVSTLTPIIKTDLKAKEEIKEIFSNLKTVLSFYF